jgi:GNAT superfamily N-acetyltransferase
VLSANDREYAAGCGQNATVRVRRADASDADAVADLFVRARHHAVPAVPFVRRSDADARAFIAGAVRSGRGFWVAEAEGGEVVALMQLEEDWVEQLYVDPRWTGRGIGTQLIETAKHERPDGLQLWTFQSNVGAHRFYERQGFVAVERTDGRNNQEQAPDVRYVWRPD